jgi:hypothetical protein
LCRYDYRSEGVDVADVKVVKRALTSIFCYRGTVGPLARNILKALLDLRDEDVAELETLMRERELEVWKHCPIIAKPAQV